MFLLRQLTSFRALTDCIARPSFCPTTRHIVASQLCLHDFIERVELKMNKMASQTTMLPIDYYQLPFCEPTGGPKMDSMNLGQILAGDRIQSSPYDIRMKQDEICKQLCVTYLGPREQTGLVPNSVVKAIRLDYYNNWLLDDLPIGWIEEDMWTVGTRTWKGTPLGFFVYVGMDMFWGKVNYSDGYTPGTFIYNHVNFEISYYPVEDDPDMYRIVRVIAEPFSIKHDFQLSDHSSRIANIINPIPSCSGTSPNHTNFGMLYIDRKQEPQPASGKVLFTYDVRWNETNPVANRWDAYLSMDRAIPATVHWQIILFGAVVTSILFFVILCILRRSIRQGYRSVISTQDQPTIENSLEIDIDQALELPENEPIANNGQGNCRPCAPGDVILPQSPFPLLLASCCGLGTQLICTSVSTLLLAASGAIGQAKPGSLLMTILSSYALYGSVGGFVSASFYRAFQGENWTRPANFVSLSFPSFVFCVVLITNRVASVSGASYDFYRPIIGGIIIYWFVILSPLIYLGASFGNQTHIAFPVTPTQCLREVPIQHNGVTQLLCTLLRCSCRLIQILATVLGVGFLLFWTCFGELQFVLDSIWAGHYYDSFGFLLFIFINSAIACAEVSIISCWVRLRKEKYQWLWNAFLVPSSIGMFSFLYSFSYFEERIFYSRQILSPLARYWWLHYTRPVYFGSMAVFSACLFLMAGTIGVSACFIFNKYIFGIDK